MPESDKNLEKALWAWVLRLNAGISGIVTGILAGLVIFIATEWLVLKGGKPVGPHLALLSQFFYGYKVTFLGGVIGFAYGFVIGFFIGYFVARIYNWFIDFKERKHPGSV